MNVQQIMTAVGTAVTTFLIVGTITIEVIMATTGGDIGPGIVGVFIGAFGGLAAAVAVGLSWGQLAERTRVVLLAYATFGLTMALLASLSYANVPGIDVSLSFWRNLAVAVAVALLAAVAVWRRGRSSSDLLAD